MKSFCCADCQKVKPEECFSGSREHEPFPWCWDCRLVKEKLDASRADRKRLHSICRHYGIKVRQHRRMLQQQKKRCAICRKQIKLVIDHCHTHGHIRGLLCGSCNIGLGAFKDDPASLLAAIQYLNDTQPQLTLDLTGGPHPAT